MNTNRPKKELFNSTMIHVEKVNSGMNFVSNLIKAAGHNHDWSKIKFFDEYWEASKSENIKDTNWFKEYHLKERHHFPEDVNFIDIIERMVNMCAADEEFDWKRASIDPSILVDAYYNTLELILDNKS